MKHSLKLIPVIHLAPVDSKSQHPPSRQWHTFSIIIFSGYSVCDVVSWRQFGTNFSENATIFLQHFVLSHDFLIKMLYVKHVKTKINLVILRFAIHVV